MSGGGGGDDEYEVNINLTALLDVLTNLLFFLMLGLASQQANMELNGDFQLPTSSADTPPTKTVSITIAKQELRFEKEPIARLRANHVDGIPAYTSRIEVLYRRLAGLKNENNSKDLLVSDVLLILCDQKTSYGLLHQVLNTAAEAGFPKFRMATTSD